MAYKSNIKDLNHELEGIKSRFNKIITNKEFTEITIDLLKLLKVGNVDNSKRLKLIFNNFNKWKDTLG